MKKRSYKAELQDAILCLEEEQVVQLHLLRANFHQVYENIHPKKLLKNTLKEISSSPYLVDSLLSTGVGVAAGYATKLAVRAGSKNVFKKMLAIALQIGVTNLIAQNPNTLKSLISHFSHTFRIEK